MLAMVVYLCYPSILELEVWDQKFRDIFGYREKWGQPGIHESLCQKEKSKTRQNYCKTPEKSKQKLNKQTFWISLNKAKPSYLSSLFHSTPSASERVFEKIVLPLSSMTFSPGKSLLTRTRQNTVTRNKLLAIPGLWHKGALLWVRSL